MIIQNELGNCRRFRGITIIPRPMRRSAGPNCYAVVTRHGKPGPCTRRATYTHYAKWMPGRRNLDTVLLCTQHNDKAEKGRFADLPLK